MPFLTSRSVLLAKLEGVELAHIAPNPATDALVTVGTPVVTVEPEEINRGISNPSLSDWGFVVGITTVSLTFTTEFKGPGRAIGASTPIREDPLLRACGMGPTYDTASVVYNFYTDSCTASRSATATFYAHIDGVLQVIRGCRGMYQVMLEDGQFPKIQWTFKGLYDSLTPDPVVGDFVDAALPSPTYDALTVAPPPFMGATFGMHGDTSELVCQAFNINVNNNVVTRKDFQGSRGLRGVLITERQVTGTMNPEVTTRAVHDFWYQHQTASLGAAFIELDPGVVTQSWDVIRIDLPSVQYKVPKWGDRDGIRIYDIDWVATRDISGSGAGDDEMSLTIAE